jgi:PAS domain S-box-containing protein
LAIGFRLALDPVLGQHSPYLPSVLAVLAAAWFGGRGPGGFCTVLSALAIWYFLIEIRFSFTMTHREALVGLGLFATAGSLISLLVGKHRDSFISLARAEASLRRKTQLVDLSHDAIITADSARRITGWNSGATEMYGWTENQVLGRVVHELLQTTGALSTSEIDAVVLRKGRWDGELNHVAADGRRLVVESRQVLLRNASGAEGILEINRDVTAREQAEEELRRANEQRLLALTSANMGTWDLDVLSRQVAWDESTRALFGVDGADTMAYA